MSFVENLENKTHTLFQTLQFPWIFLTAFHISVEVMVRAPLPSPERSSVSIRINLLPLLGLDPRSVSQLKQSYFFLMAMEENKMSLL